MDLFTLVAKLTIDKSQYEQGLDEAESEASSAGGGFASALGKVGKAAGTIAKVGAAGIAAGSAAVGALAKQSIDAYGEYEQLVGGVETLFGDSAQKVIADAGEAYKTAGMSMNDYMETSIQSAASLINSLDGDQAKAAELMNMSITDMADNVNKMGTSMEGVQNAYRGFSRGNFTMLDNLALGFAGTKDGMQQLLDKAKELSGVEYNIDSYADIVEAIHVVQNEMGITGTTSKEASSTIEGSLNAVKSAWTNLVAGFANGDADLGQLMDNLVVALVGENEGEGLLNNILPAIERALKGIGEFIAKAAPIISAKLPELMNAILPSLLTAATSLFAGLVSALPSLIQVIIDQAPTMLGMIGEALINAGGQLVEVGGNLLTSLFNGLMEGIPKLVEFASEILSNIGTGIEENLPGFLETVLPKILSFTEMLKENAGQLISAGMEMLLSIAQGLADGLPTLIEYVPQIITNIANIINENGPKILATGVQIIVTLVQGLITAIPTIVANIPKIIQAIVAVWSAFNWVNLGKNVITAIKNGFNALKTELPNALKNIGNSAVNFFKSIDWIGLGKTVITAIGNGITGLMALIPQLIGGIATTAFNLFTSIDWLGLGSSVITSIGGGITKLVTLVPDLMGGILGSVTAKFAQIDWIDIGKGVIDKLYSGISSIGSSIADFFGDIVDDIKDLFDFEWKLPELKLPHIVVERYIDVPVLGTIPDPTSMYVDWYKKAYDVPYMFTEPTVLPDGRGFGDGPGGEIVYGRNSLMRDIREAVGDIGGTTFAPVINVYGNGKSDREIADEIMNRLEKEYFTARGRW
jgi:phage-related protein